MSVKYHALPCGRAFEMLFWRTNAVCGTLFVWPGLENALLGCQLSTRNALPVAGP